MGCGASEESQFNTQNHLQRPPEFLFKSILIGDSGVGKSSLLLRITGDVFSENFISTIGVDINVKSFEVDGDIIKLQIWDTAGQERFRTITSSYYRGAHGVIVVYDVTNPQTFANVRNWYQDISRYAAENAHLVLVGNKCDLDQERKVSTQDGQHLAQQLNMTFFETSAKNSTNVSEVFLKLVTDLKEQIKSPQ